MITDKLFIPKNTLNLFDNETITTQSRLSEKIAFKNTYIWAL